MAKKKPPFSPPAEPAFTPPPWFALYEERLAALAEEAASGAADTDLTLADIVDSAPQDMRSGLIGRFRALVQEKEAAREPALPPTELTPEQERLALLLAEHEQAFMIHIASKKRLEKIRQMMMLNPQLLEEVLGLGDALVKRGMLLEAGRLRQRAEAQAPNQTPVRKNNEERER